MTPRQVDVAFVLEGVAGVLDVYAVEEADERGRDFAFAVRIAHGGRNLAAAHYALLRVLTHGECKNVLFVELDLPKGIAERATRIELSSSEREEARARVLATSPALEQRPSAPPLQDYERPNFRVLLVGAAESLVRVVVDAFGTRVERVVEPDPAAAFWKARNEHFGLILCDARQAFGEGGFLTDLVGTDRVTARRVVLVGHEGERELLMSNLDDLGTWNSILSLPTDAETLREILRTGAVVQSWTTPDAPARDASSSPSSAQPSPSKPAASTRRVVVVDDDPATGVRLAKMRDNAVPVIVTSDEWEAVDLVGEGDVLLVVCSASMKTLGGVPFYRLLWNARPELKRRFVFIARPDAVPARAPMSQRSASVIERPITCEAVTELVERFTQLS